MALTFQNCTLCPRACGVDRTGGARGFCGQGATLRVARAALHPWEEPVLAGCGGSGTVFFSGCTLRCSFCQNHEISTGGFGKEISSARLREIFLELIDQGAQNINLVTPTHFLPAILPALTPKLPVPVVYNCGGYECVETLKELDGLVDIYLPDFKYADSRLASQLSAAADYPEIARAAIGEMLRQTGAPVFDGERLTRGTIVRHLILPGQVENSLKALDLLEPWRDVIILSIMRQYTPMPPASLTPPFDRAVTDDEAAAVLSWAQLCGFSMGFFQDAESMGENFIPKFDGSGVDKPGGAVV